MRNLLESPDSCLPSTFEWWEISFSSIADLRHAHRSPKSYHPTKIQSARTAPNTRLFTHEAACAKITIVLTSGYSASILLTKTSTN